MILSGVLELLPNNNQRNWPLLCSGVVIADHHIVYYNYRHCNCYQNQMDQTWKKGNEANNYGLLYSLFCLSFCFYLTYTQSQQEDVTKKLQKYADLHQKGILSDEELVSLTN
jgi:hypothetical protein